MHRARTCTSIYEHALHFRSHQGDRVSTHTQVPAAKGGSGPQEIVFSIHKNLAKSGWYAKSTKKRHQHVRLVAARTKATAKSRTACIVV